MRQTKDLRRLYDGTMTVLAMSFSLEPSRRTAATD